MTTPRDEPAPLMTPKEIEDALKGGFTTGHVNDDATRMTIILRPKHNSRVFQMIVAIEEVKEL